MSEKNKKMVQFGKPYLFEGKEYTELSLEGLDHLTSEQLFEAAKHFQTTEYITPRPEADGKYCCLLAAQVCGLPMEFFDRLPAKDGIRVRNAVQDFFQSED